LAIWQSLAILEELVIFAISTPARPAAPPISVWRDDNGSLRSNHAGCQQKTGFIRA